MAKHLPIHDTRSPSRFGENTRARDDYDPWMQFEDGVPPIVHRRANAVEFSDIRYMRQWNAIKKNFKLLGAKWTTCGIDKDTKIFIVNFKDELSAVVAKLAYDESHVV